jgi:hypothetical protein
VRMRIRVGCAMDLTIRWSMVVGSAPISPLRDR